MKISKNFLLLGMLALSVVSTMLSCKDDGADETLVGNWLVKSDYDGNARSQAVAFSIGNYGYVGAGYNFENDVRLKDFWRYDPDVNNWTPIAPLDYGVSAHSRAKARSGAVAFTALGKGYVGLGKDDEGNLLGDFWVYDPATNKWDTLIAANQGPTARYGAVAFSINDVGYVGTGNDGSNLKDLWAFDPNTNTWTQKTSFQSKVSEAVAFVLNGKGYICTGYHNEYSKDFYMYDPETNLWSEKRKIADVSDESYDDEYTTMARRKAVAFVIGTKAYITTGDVNNSLKEDVWEYDPATDLWDDKTNFEGSPRNEAVAFSLQDGRGFVTTGVTSTTDFDDLWEFKPADEANEDD
jgi:N-acetylneuraminic acid mutarotase